MIGCVRRTSESCRARCRARPGAWLAPASPPFFDLLAVRLGVVSPIPLNVLRSAARCTAPSAHPRDLVEQRQQLGDVMAVGPGQDARQRDPSAVGEQMVLASQFAPIRWIWAGFCASTRGAQRGAIHEGPIPVNLVLLLKLGQQGLEQALPDPGLMPPLQSPPTGVSRGEITGRREPAPGDARPQYEENAVENAPSVAGLSSGILHMAVLSRLGNQRLKAVSQFVRENNRGHTEDLKRAFHLTQLNACRTMLTVS